MNFTAELLFDGMDRLEALDLEGDAADMRDEAVSSINASTGTYRQATLAESEETFEHLRDAHERLGHLEAETGTDLSDERATLVEASNVSARLEIRTAYETVTDHEFETPGQEQRAESALGNAVDAMERGDSASGKNAILHYRNAWRHADAALDPIADSTEPELTLTEQMAIEQDGTVMTPVLVSVTDVRPYAYEELSVVYDDGETETIDLFADLLPGGSADGVIHVDLGPEVQDRTLTITATSTRHPDRSVEETLILEVDDGDVVPERPAPDEYAEVEIEDEKSGVTVEAGGDGLFHDDVEIADYTPDSDHDFQAGPVVRIENRTPIDEATVTIPLADGVEDTDNLSVYTLDESDSSGWEPLETEIDPEARTATATVESFSYFSVFHQQRWDDYLTETITLEDRHFADGDDGGGEPIAKADFVFVVDESGSMSGARIRNARTATQRFVAALAEDEQAGLVGYSTGASLIEGLTTDHDALNDSIDELSAGGLTNTGAGLTIGLEELESNGWENRSSVIILLSDGYTNRGPDPIAIAEDAADNDVEISTVGLGSSIDEQELQEIASITGGEYYHVEDADDLPDTFERVADNRTEPTLRDTNGDGIPDAVAEANPVIPRLFDRYYGALSDLPRINIDPVARDTSGDGLADNETIDVEYRVFTEDGETKLETRVTDAVAHPALLDTANNGLTDYEEVMVWGTDPWRADTSGDGFIDSVDPAPLEETTPPEMHT
ncbi:vWA domain-containing protein [Natronobeatus ordinarius]|uniref:vWA domain-containing protein n=1 Tax=Natronobeatus ordinarius TaxID=2963433 RepID=UPI0020CEF65F|nr:VWA domain-containing protein [Natronobeatus ordinarius]